MRRRMYENDGRSSYEALRRKISNAVRNTIWDKLNDMMSDLPSPQEVERSIPEYDSERFCSYDYQNTERSDRMWEKAVDAVLDYYLESILDDYFEE